MSLPFIPETMTIEQFEAHMKTVGSEVQLRDDNGDPVATVRYDYGYPKTPWVYDFLGECGRYAQDKKKRSYCAAWVQEPYIRRYAQLADLMFFIAFVGLEYS